MTTLDVYTERAGQLRTVGLLLASLRERRRRRERPTTEEFIADLVAAAPPLSGEQRQHLRTLLAPIEPPKAPPIPRTRIRRSR